MKMKNTKMVVVFAISLLIAGGSWTFVQMRHGAVKHAAIKAVRYDVADPAAISAFSSFDSRKRYRARVTCAVYGEQGGRGYRGQAEWFSPKVSGALDVIEIAVHGQGLVNIILAEDEKGIPGKWVEQFEGVTLPRKAAAPLLLKSKNRPVLNLGTKYWLCAEPAQSSTAGQWAQNNQKLQAGSAYENEQGKWASLGQTMSCAFSVSLVPTL